MPRKKQVYENNEKPDKLTLRLSASYSVFFKDCVSKSDKTMNAVFNEMVRDFLIKNKYFKSNGSTRENVSEELKNKAREHITKKSGWEQKTVDDTAADKATPQKIEDWKTWRDAVVYGKNNEMPYGDILNFVIDKNILDCEEDLFYIEYYNYIAPWEE